MPTPRSSSVCVDSSVPTTVRTMRVIRARFGGNAETGGGGSSLPSRAGGSSVAKKNFWTFLGSMPFKVSGGALASYSLLEGSTGRVLRAGTLADMQPLKKLSEISISAAD